MNDFTLVNGQYVFNYNKNLSVNAQNFEIILNGDVVGKGETLSISFDLARTLNHWM